jgi:phosphomannomutase
MKYQFNPKIFKAYDVRGLLNEEELSSQTAFFIGACFGSFIKSGKVAVGGDARSSSNKLKSQLIKGLLQMGIDVVDIGVVPTPLCYFAVPHLKLDGSIMVTGSHNPPEYNGFKITLKDGSLSGEELKSFIKIASEGVNFSSKEGRLEFGDISKDYISEATRHSSFKVSKKLKIGIDAMNGSGGAVLKEICKLIPFEFVVKNAEMTGDFSKILAEPSKPANVEMLKEFLLNENLDIVFAFDGDADRVFMITPEKVWYGDDLTLFLAYNILKERGQGKVIFDVKSSIVLDGEIKKLGGEPIVYKTGHSLIKQELMRINAILAGEMSGHIYINDGKFYPFDDGIYCFIRILEYLTKIEEIPNFPHTYKTAELKLKVEDKDLFLQELKQKILKLNPTKILEIDGIKGYFGETSNIKSAILARKSNTEDVVIARVESYDKDEFESLKSLLEMK